MQKARRHAKPVASVQAFSREIGRARLMIADDDPTTVELVRSQLSGVGHRDFVECLDSREVLRQIASKKPDLLLLDVMMPEVNGLELLRQIRGAEATSRLPVIVLTAATDGDTRFQAFQLGATDFLTKPADFVELAARVRNALIVKAYQDELKRHALELERRVEEQTAQLRQSYADIEKANAILRHSCDAAEAASRAKSDFLAKMSHEVRTPLTAIIGFAEELLDGDPRNDPALSPSDMLRAIHRSGKHLLQIVNDLLDVARIEKGQIALDCVPCSPAKVLSSVVALLRPLAAAKGIALVVESVAPVPETIRTDPLRLQQILTNLIGNAVKFTPRGSVRVVLQSIHPNSQSPLLRFDVVDTGIGIPPEQISEIFKPFAQATTHGAARACGTGLGLTISKYLVEALGGQVAVESEPDKGSTFSVMIPIADPQPEDASRDGDRDLDENSAPVLASRGPLCGHVLLAEDAPDNQRLIALVLEKAGARVTVVEDGELAYQGAMDALRRGQPFDVILTDLQMPRLDGYGLVQRLRQEGYDKPVIAVTANAMAGEREKCLLLGCDDYLCKPIDRSKLIRAVANCVDSNRRPSS